MKIKNKLKIAVFSIFISALAVTSASANEVSVTGTQTVILDGQVFTPEYPLLVVNDRLMVPLIAFSNAMEAQIAWDEALAQASVFRNNRFSFIRIGQSVMQHGPYTFNNLGVRQLGLISTSVMDAPAMIFADRTYIPLRAISESLGASVEWIESSSTAVIISTPTGSIGSNNPDPSLPPNTTLPVPPNLPNLNPVPGPGPNQTTSGNQQRPANYGDFSNRSHFTNITSRQAGARHQDATDHPFILVVYNSSNHYSRMIVPSIQDAAQNAGVRVFGLDRYVGNVQNNESQNTWLWQFTRQQGFNEPAIFFVYARNTVRVVQRNSINLETLESQLLEFSIRAATQVDVGDFRNTNWFRNVSSQFVSNMYDNNHEFIFVLYDSSERESALELPFLIAGARALDHRVIYAVDVELNPNYRIHLQNLNVPFTNTYPQVFLIYRNNNRRSENSLTPNSVLSARDLIIEFLTNSVIFETPPPSVTNPNNNQNNQNNQGGNNQTNQNFEDLHHYRFPNTSAFTINERFRLGNNFIVAIYDSSRPYSVAIAEAIRGAAIASHVTVYSVNLNSNLWNNRNSDALYWLRLARGTGFYDAELDFPLMIHFNNQGVVPGGFIEFRQTNLDAALSAAHNFIIRTRSLN